MLLESTNYYLKNFIFFLVCKCLVFFIIYIYIVLAWKYNRLYLFIIYTKFINLKETYIFKKKKLKLHFVNNFVYALKQGLGLYSHTSKKFIKSIYNYYNPITIKLCLMFNVLMSNFLFNNISAENRLIIRVKL